MADNAWVDVPLLLRSALYVPGGNARALAKAATLNADAIIFDLEDGVLPEKKAEARQMIARALQEDAFDYRRVLVRVNSPASLYFKDDIKALEGLQVDAVVVPKVHAPSDIKLVCEALDKHCGDYPVWAMIETASGVLHAAEIAAHPRVEALLLGLEDLAKDLHMPPGEERAALKPYMVQVVLAARANGCMVFDGIHRDIQDFKGLESECWEARMMGFDGKTVIHPSGLAVANEIFAPSEAEVSEARKVREALAEAKAEGKAVALLQGKMVEPLHGERAHTVLRKAEIARDRERR